MAALGLPEFPTYRLTLSADRANNRRRPHPIESSLMQDSILNNIFSALFLASILRVVTPILLPSLGALVSNQAGVINVGLEGIMLAAAFTGAIVSANTQSAWIGALAGVLAGVALALLLAFFHLQMNGDLVLGGVAINILGSAGTVALMVQLTGDQSSTSGLKSLLMPTIDLPILKSIPLIGDFLYVVLGTQNVVTWLALLSVAAIWFLLYRTPIGRHIRAVGENPDAAASVGIDVRRIRYLALGLSGALAGLGGVYMSMGYLTSFIRDMTAGRGFIALATPALGNNAPLGTALASLFFGFAYAFSLRLGTLNIPPEYAQMIPYVATILALVLNALSIRRVAAARARQYREARRAS